MMNTHRTVLIAVVACALSLGVAPLVAWSGSRRANALRQAGGGTTAVTGDTSRGRALMESNACFDCHRVGDRGSRLGPDLSDIGDRRTPDRLQQALMAPDEEVLPENRFVRAVTKDGAAVIGRLLNQDAISVQLINPKEELRSYLKSNLREFTIVDKGMMPTSLGKLTGPQIVDVVAYLGSLKGN